jgi:hypothetical protein
VEAAGNPNVRQAFQRVQLQVSSGSGPLSSLTTTLAPQNPTGRSTGAAAAASVGAAPAAPVVDPAPDNPQEAFRAEVKKALIDAMLDHSAPLGLADDERLTVSARGNEDRPRLAPGDYESPIVQLTVKGSDLAAFQAKQITREEAIARIVEKVF